MTAYTSTAYRSGSVRSTVLSQQQTANVARVDVAAASGGYAAAPASRDTVVELVTGGAQASAVTLNGTPLPRHADKAAFDAATSGWYNAGGDLVVAKSGTVSVTTAKAFAFTLDEPQVSLTFSCSNGTTVSGQSVYAVGSAPQLGEWSVASAVKLEPTAYPTWTGTVSALPPNTAVEWKCIKRPEDNHPDTADQWQSGPTRPSPRRPPDTAGPRPGDSDADGRRGPSQHPAGAAIGGRGRPERPAQHFGAPSSARRQVPVRRRGRTPGTT